MLGFHQVVQGGPKKPCINEVAMRAQPNKCTDTSEKKKKVFHLPDSLMVLQNIFFVSSQNEKKNQKVDHTLESLELTQKNSRSCKIHMRFNILPQKKSHLISHSHEHPSAPHIYILPGHVPFEKICFNVFCSFMFRLAG